MSILEKIKHLLPHEVHLYKEGAFWVAYEQSAYAICRVKAYKATKKFVKAAGMEVVSVGFPENALASVVEVGSFLPMVEAGAASATDGQPSNNHIILHIEHPIDETEFRKWKNGIELSNMENVGNAKKLLTTSLQEPSPQPPASTAIVERLKSFDLSNATPMESMMFLSELKRNIYAYSLF